MGSCVSSPGRLSLSSGRGGRALKPMSSSSSTSETIIGPIVVDGPRAGTDIASKYEMGEEVGRGEFGVTYRCRSRETGKEFACKAISKGKLKTSVDVEDVRREVRIMRHLPSHKNIVSFEEAFEDDHAVYLVMELCRGGELFDRIVARGHYSERAAASTTKSMLNVCRLCHRHGVIHRDLKPENFLLKDADNDSSHLKAIDFGLSIFFKPGQRFSEIVGSPYYMAPEVLRRDYGPEIDIWSVGVILYILLCGVPPFWAETEEGIAQAIIIGKIDFDRDPWPKVSREAKDLVTRMLDPDPYTRLTIDQAFEHRWLHDSESVPNVSLGENVRIRIKQFSLMNRFKKRVLRVVADNLSEDQMDGLKQLFDMMDTDKNGDLSFEELRDGFHLISHPVSDPDVKMLIEAADADGSGTLSCEEFVTMSVHLKRIGSDEHLSQAFRYFDKNRSGYIEFEELREALLDDNLDPNNDQVVHDILFDVDLDKDGRISYEEFKAMMKTGTDWKMSSRQYSRAMLNALSSKMFKPKTVHTKLLKSGPL